MYTVENCKNGLVLEYILSLYFSENCGEKRKSAMHAISHLWKSLYISPAVSAMRCQNFKKMKDYETNYSKVISSNSFCLEAHAGICRLLMKGIFDAYVLCPFDKKLILLLVRRINTRNFMVYTVVGSRALESRSVW